MHHLAGDGFGGGFVVGGQLAVNDQREQVFLDRFEPGARASVEEHHQLVAIERALDGHALCFFAQALAARLKLGDTGQRRARSSRCDSW